MFYFRFRRQTRTCPKCLRHTTFTTCTHSRQLAMECTRLFKIPRCQCSLVHIISLRPRRTKWRQSTSCRFHPSSRGILLIRCGITTRAAIFPATTRQMRNILLTKTDHPITIIISNLHILLCSWKSHVLVE